jgi:hypothetical protein
MLFGKQAAEAAQCCQCCAKETQNFSPPAAAKAEAMNAPWTTSRRGCSVLPLLCKGNPKFSPPAAAKTEVMNALWETSRRGWPMFCNGCLLQSENVSRLNVLVSSPTARQRDRLKMLLLPFVSPPRNPRADPANNFPKRVSQLAIGNPKINLIFKPHGTVLFLHPGSNDRRGSAFSRFWEFLIAKRTILLFYV